MKNASYYQHKFITVNIYVVAVQAKVQNTTVVGVLTLVVRSDLAGVLNVASMGAEMFGWLGHDGYNSSKHWY